MLSACPVCMQALVPTAADAQSLSGVSREGVSMCMQILHIAVIDVRVLQHMMAVYTGANYSCLGRQNKQKANGVMMFVIHTKHSLKLTKAASGVKTLNSAPEAQRIKPREKEMPRGTDIVALQTRHGLVYIAVTTESHCEG